MRYGLKIAAVLIFIFTLPDVYSASKKAALKKALSVKEGECSYGIF